jgi:cytochrome c6
MKGDERMKRITIVVAVIFIASLSTVVFAEKSSVKNPGEAKFKEHCTLCHPDGGNIVNPRKTLHKKDLTANNVNNVGDILKIVRNPGPGMTPFDAKTLSDKDAEDIAKYILKTFK